MVRALDRGVAVRPAHIGGPDSTGEAVAITPESRLAWATGDDYDILAPLGTGSFGAVWRVRELSLGREVALKMLHPHVARDADAVARFRREATIAAQLSHPAIVPIFGFEERGGTSWFTMELAEGGSVASSCKRAGPRPDARGRPADRVRARGARRGARVGVVHRDLKPENLLIDRYRRWRVADFGIANALGEWAAGNSGTPAFAPPEQLLGEPQGPGRRRVRARGDRLHGAERAARRTRATARPVLAAQLAGRRRSTTSACRWPSGCAPRSPATPTGDSPDAAAALGAWRRVRAAVERTERRERWWRRAARAIGVRSPGG
jgi:serine/threonine-protein kinase